MRHYSRIVVAAAALVLATAQAHGQETADWIGQRVITKFGTVLKVGTRVVDRENVRRTAPGVHRRDFRVYRVERVESTRVWLEAEYEYVSGWVPATQVVPLDRAIDYYTNTIGPTRGTARTT